MDDAWLMQLLSEYVSNIEFYAPITFSFIVVALLAGFSFFLPNEQIRSFLLLPLAFFFLWYSRSGSNFEQEFYLNMATELFGTVLALFLFATIVTTNRWTFPVIVGVTILMLVFIFTINFEDTNSISLNMSTEILGAMLTTVWLKRDWLWGSRRKKKFSRFTRARHKKRRQDLQDLDKNFQIHVSGLTESELENKINHLRQQQLVIKTISSIKYDNKKDHMYCVVQAQMAVTDSP